VNAIIETAIKKIYLTTDVAAVIEEVKFSALKPGQKPDLQPIQRPTFAIRK
jgi:hypothetical protein